jgi:hypothetical protein
MWETMPSRARRLTVQTNFSYGLSNIDASILRGVFFKNAKIENNEIIDADK